MRNLFIALTLLLSSSAFATFPTPSADAQALLKQINQVNCNEFASGFYCYINVNAKLVDVIVPRNYKASGDCIVHFHGLRIRDPEDVTPHSTIEYFKFADDLFSYAPGTLMIVPIGAYGTYNYNLDTNYGTLAKVKALLDGVSLRTNVTCSNLTLSGHSAAYRVLTPLLNQVNANPNNAVTKMLSYVFLFDALYSSNVGDFSTWVADSSFHNLFNVSQSDSSTRTNSLRIKSNVRYLNYVSTISDHWNLVRDKYFASFLQLR